MTPAEAESWALDQPHRTPNPIRVNTDAACMVCPAPVYLNNMCAAHWRLLVGYGGHVRLREMATLSMEEE